MQPGRELDSKSVELSWDCQVTSQSNLCHAIDGSLYNSLYTEAVVEVGAPTLEVSVDGKWYQVPPKSTLPEIWYCPLPARDSMYFVINLDDLSDYLPDGTYRYLFTMRSEGRTYLLAAEFTVKQS